MGDLNFQGLFNGQIPFPWRRFMAATQKPLGSWFDFFIRRFKQYHDWVNNGEPKVMWLSGLQIAETFTVALVQATCRRYIWPLDKSTLYTKVTKMVDSADIKEKLVDGCYVEGLYLEGASWDHEKACLRIQDPKRLVEELPIMQVIPIEMAKLKLQNTLSTPVYITQDRRNAMGVGLMMQADISSYEHSSHWILQGVAIVMNTDS